MVKGSITRIPSEWVVCGSNRVHMVIVLVLI